MPYIRVGIVGPNGRNQFYFIVRNLAIRSLGLQMFSRLHRHIIFCIWFKDYQLFSSLFTVSYQVSNYFTFLILACLGKSTVLLTDCLRHQFRFDTLFYWGIT